MTLSCMLEINMVQRNIFWYSNWYSTEDDSSNIKASTPSDEELVN